MTVNEMALRDIANGGALSAELWEAVKRVAMKVLYKYRISQDEMTGLAAIAVYKALEHWDPEKGDFALLVHYHAGSQAQVHHIKFSQGVRLPYATRGDQFNDYQTLRPDAMATSEGIDTAGSFWDTLGSDEHKSVLIDSEFINLIISKLNDKEADFIRSVYIDGTTIKNWAELNNMSQSSATTLHWLIKEKFQTIRKQLGDES